MTDSLHPDSIVIEPELSDSDDSTVTECTVTLDELQGKPKLTAREKQIIKKLTKKCEPSEKQKAHTERMRQKAYEKARERRKMEAEFPLIKKELEELKAKLTDSRPTATINNAQTERFNRVTEITVSPKTKPYLLRSLDQSKKSNNLKKFQW